MKRIKLKRILFVSFQLERHIDMIRTNYTEYREVWGFTSNIKALC